MNQTPTRNQKVDLMNQTPTRNQKVGLINKKPALAKDFIFLLSNKSKQIERRLKMKRCVMSMTLVLIFLSFIFSPSSLKGQESEKPEKTAYRGRPMAAENFLDLTPEQRSKLEEFRKMCQEERRELMDNMRAVREELRELMRDPEANEKKILGLYDQISKFRSSRFKKFVQHRKEMRKILTPEQLDKLEKFRNRIAQRRDLGRARFGGRRGFFRRGPFPQERFYHFGRRGRNFRGWPFMWRWWR